jgi:hypothetical protein
VLFFLVRWLVPETKGRSLEQIERDLRGGRMSGDGAGAVIPSPATEEPGEAGLVSEA